jgi:uncharacterized protein (TIGR03435 family)
MISASIHHVWQSTLFAATAALVLLAFRRNRAQVRYWLWFSASAKFLVPFSFLIGLAPGASGEATMEGPMLQALLEDRFRLKVHRETRQVPVYALTVAKGRPKFHPAVEGDCVPLPVPPIFPPPELPPGKRPCSDVIAPKGPNVRVIADASTIDYLSKLLGLVLDRPIINRTGLTGKYKIYVEFARDQSTTGLDDFPVQPTEEPSAPSIFTAVEQQLGLKLEATKGPREFLVIDHIERPSEN